MVLLEAEGVSCGYEKKPVLRGIGFGVRRGEMVGVIGPNGSGKTTLLRLLSRVILPETGRLYWEGRDISSIPVREWARKTAVVSQSPPLTDMTVEEFVLLGRIPYLGRLQLREKKEDQQAVQRALDRTGIASMKKRRLARMSGGERQMALIARALAQEPELLLLDEPTTHLDVSHQVEVMDLVSRLNEEEGLTVMIVLHDLNLAAEYCPRLLLLHGGRIQADGRSEEVLTEAVLGPTYPVPLRVERNPYSGRPHLFVISKKRSKERDPQGEPGAGLNKTRRFGS